MVQFLLTENNSNENRLEIYKDIEFELEKLLDLRKNINETEKCNYSASVVSY